MFLFRAKLRPGCVPVLFPFRASELTPKPRRGLRHSSWPGLGGARAAIVRQAGREWGRPIRFGRVWIEESETMPPLVF